MRRRLLSLLTALLLCALPAAADNSHPTTSIIVGGTLSQYAFSAPGPVDVTIFIELVGINSPCMLYDPDGRVVAVYEPSPGHTNRFTWTGTWNVSQEQLDAGEIVFTTLIDRQPAWKSS